MDTLADVALGFVYSGMTIDLHSIVAAPLLVALAEIGLRNGTMWPENATVLVGAGVLTVLVLPATAVATRRPEPPTPEG